MHRRFVFVVAPTGRDGQLISELLARHDVVCEVCPTIRDLCRQLAVGAGVIVLTDEALAPGTFRELESALDAQPPWSDIPLILLASKSDDFSLVTLGFSEDNLTRIHRAMKKPYGLILATGPTGSGKTTTLYMILKEINKPEISVITIEDPIEYSLPGGSVRDEVCYWGEHVIGPHLFHLLGKTGIGAALTFGEPVTPAGDRKVLARELHERLVELRGFEPAPAGSA